MNTIKDVANLAGVSVATVYKVFSNSYATGTEIRDKVLEAAEKLNYSPKAKSSRTGDNDIVVGLVFSEVMNPFTSSLIDVITKELSHFQCRVIVFYSNENETIEEDNIKLVRKLNLDALVYGPVAGRRYGDIEEMITEGKPVVQMFSAVYPNLDTIMFDDELGTYLAIKTLLQNGHRRILMIYKNRPIMPKREPGYYRAFREYNLEVDDRFLFRLDFDDSIKGMIKDKIEELKPTAILTVNESISIGMIQALTEMRLTIPDNISLIVYDDLPWAAASGYTTVAHPFEQVGTLCRNLIIKGMDKTRKLQVEQAPVKLVIDPMIISRDSVRIISPSGEV